MFDRLYEILPCCCCCFRSEKSKDGRDDKHNNNNNTKSSNVIVRDMTYTNNAFVLDRVPEAVPVKLNTHPLQNSLILSKIFAHLPVSDLIRCRIVSEQWRKEATKVLQRKSHVVGISHEELPGFIKTMKKSNQENLNPYRRYALNLMTIPTSLKSSTNRRMDLKAFFQTFGSQISMLIVRILELDVPFFVEYLNMTPSVETLLLIIASDDMSSISPTNSISDPTEFQNGQINFHDAQKQLQVSQNQIQKLKYELRLPKLTEFRVAINGPSHIDRCIIEILNSSCNIQILDFKKWATPISGLILEDSKYLANVHQFISNPMNNSQLTQLSQNIWSGNSMQNVVTVLTYLEIEICSDVQDEVLFQLFKVVSGSLEILQASHRGKHSSFHFPILMPKLQTLVLKDWKGPILVDSILLNAPCLEKLDFEAFNPDNIVVHKTTIEHPKLERLGVLYDEEYPKRKIKGVLKRLLPKFPNLQDFYSGAETDDIFELVIRQINPRLSSLFVDFSMEISDASVTGIPIDVIETCPDENAVHLSCGCWVLRNQGEVRINPYIGDLQELQQVHISLEDGSQVTNISLHHGFSDLKNLKVLRLFSKEISFCLYAIGENLCNLQKLHLKSRHLYRQEDIQYLKDKLPHLEIEFTNDSPDYMYFVQRIPLQDPHEI